MKYVFHESILGMSLMLIIVFYVGFAHAENTQEEINHTVKVSVQSEQLQEYIDTAIANNAGLKAIFESYKAQNYKSKYVGALPDPKLSYANFIQSVETRVGPQEHKFGVSQSFPWFGTLSLQSKVVQDDAQFLLYQFEAKRLELIRNVKDIFYDAYFLERSIKILHQNMDLLANLERVTRSRYQSGIGQFSDVIRSQVELEKVKDQLVSIKDLKKPLIARFNSALNDSGHTILEWPNAIPLPQRYIDMNKMRELMEISNPQLKALDKVTQKEQKKIKLAKKDGLPNFSLGFDYIMTGEAANAVTDSGKDAMAVMVSMGFPLWRGKYTNQTKEAKSKEISARNTQKEKLNQLTADLSQAIYEYSEGVRKVELYRNNLVPKGRQSFEATKRGYEAGKASFSDLIDSERLLLEFQLASEEALTRASKAEASIDMLIGDQSLKNKSKPVSTSILLKENK